MLSVFFILLIVFCGIIFLYNRFVQLDHMVKEAWSDVNVQLKRRYSLISDLVEIVKGYMKYESNTLKKIVSAASSGYSSKYAHPKRKFGKSNQRKFKAYICCGRAISRFKEQ